MMKGILFLLLVVLASLYALLLMDKQRCVAENVQLKKQLAQSAEAVNFANFYLHSNLKSFKAILASRRDSNFLSKAGDLEKRYLKLYGSGAKLKDTAADYKLKISLFDSLRAFWSAWNYCPWEDDVNPDVYLSHDANYHYGDTIRVVAQMKPLLRHDWYSLVDWNYREYSEPRGNLIYFSFPTRDFVKRENLPAKLKIEISCTLRNNLTNEKRVWKFIPDLKIQ